MMGVIPTTTQATKRDWCIACLCCVCCDGQQTYFLLLVHSSPTYVFWHSWAC